MNMQSYHIFYFDLLNLHILLFLFSITQEKTVVWDQDNVLTYMMLSQLFFFMFTLQVHDNGTLVSIVSSVILRRLDKKPDRVEISEEQLVQATLRAEELAAEVGRPLRVVGWYHSHPHITVWPSHVGM